MKYFVLMISLILIASCAVDDKAVTFFNVNEDHTISLSQILSSSGGSLVFELKTNQELKCDNLVLNHIINQNEESITVWLNGYDNAKRCSNVPGIIKTNIGLKPVVKEMPVKIIMKYETAVEKNGKIKVNDGLYTLNIDNDFGINSKNNSLRLVEANTYWGQIWSADSGVSPDEAQLNELLRKYGLITPASGDYTFFVTDKTYTALQDQVVKTNGYSFAGTTSKSNFAQFINELNTNAKLKFSIRSFDDKKFEK